MNAARVLAGIVLVSVLSGCSENEPADAPSQDGDISHASILIVAHGTSVTFDGTDLVLRGVGPSLTWFTDRPEHRVGSMQSQRLGHFWSYGHDNFADNPPNAAVVVEGHAPAIVEFTDVTVADNGLTFPTLVLDGDLPETGGPTTIVIDGAPIPDCCFDPQNTECELEQNECRGFP